MKLSCARRISGFVFLLALAGCATQAREPAGSGLSHKPTQKVILSDLRRLYPELSATQVREKIENSDNSFMLYRALLPYYYDVLASDPDFQSRFGASLATRAWILGDPHPENFGVLIDGKGRSIYTMNDPDDSREGALFLDVMRLLSGMNMAAASEDVSLSFAPLWKAYLAGLKSDRDLARYRPERIEKDFEKSEERGRAVRDKDLEDNDEDEEPSSAELKKIRTWTEKKFPKAEFIEAWGVKRESGGSAFLKRYRAHLEFLETSALDSEDQVIEFKQIASSGEARTDAARIVRTLNLLFNGAVPSFYDTLVDGKTAYFMRPRWYGVRGTDLEDFKAKELPELFEFQMRVLGVLHARSLETAGEKYRQSLDGVKVSELEESAKAIRSFFEHVYRVTR